jgi:hypothetical protein
LYPFTISFSGLVLTFKVLPGQHTDQHYVMLDQ